MTEPMDIDDLTIDVVFPLEGKALPREHAQDLQQALCAALPWLDTDPVAGIHPVKLVPGSAVPALLSRRARLLLRVASRRLDELRALAGLELSVAGHALRLGAPHLHELQPHSTLYAYRVTADSADEVAFMAAVAAELAQMAIGGERVCGKHQTMSVDDRPLDTFSLMLHALPPEQSLRLQNVGLRSHRLMGCGIFVPHKSAAAVGA
jgi:CRISPR-associated protein Cas6